MNEFYLNDIVNSINKLFPLDLAEKWDNSGLQIASENKKVQNILITLDVDVTVVEYAVNNNIDLIVSHHPLIFKPINNIVAYDDIKSSIIKKLIQNNIALFSIHTNADKILFQKLANIFELKNVKPLIEEINNSEIGFGSIGELNEPTTVKKFLSIVKNKLNTKFIKYAGELNRTISRISLCGGTCTSFITKKLNAEKIDVFLTSDVKYHDAQRALELGIIIIDAGHFYTEKILLPEFKILLQKEFDNKLNIQVVDFSKDIFEYYI